MTRAKRYRWRQRGTATFSRARWLAAVLALTVAVDFGGGEALARVDHREAGTKDATDSIKLPAIIVPIIGGDGVIGQAGVEVQLQLANPNDFNLVDQARGRLVDAYFRELYGLYDQLQGTPGEVSPAIVKEHLTRVTDRILGPGKIRDIVILGSYQRRGPS
jgi:hypothetical protein